jgi:hypothetical protein
MSRLPPDLQHLTDELPDSRRRDVEAAIASSPYLLDRVRTSVQEGHLKEFKVSPSSEHSGGYYDAQEKAVYINEDTFAVSNVRSIRLDTLTFVVGHEVGHSFLANGRRLSQQELQNSINGALWTQSDQPFVDVTAPAEKFLRFTRWDESIAEIEGWNALASRVAKERSGQIELQTLLKRADPSTHCVEWSDQDNRFNLEPGITLTPDKTILIGKPIETSPNLEAVAACQYDLRPEVAKLGAQGTSDYRNNYGTQVIETIASAVNHFEKTTGQDAYEIRINLTALKLKPVLLEQNGLDLGGESLLVTDSSHGKLRGIGLRHTGSDTKASPDVEVDPPKAEVPLTLESSAHLGHQLYLQTIGALRQSPNIPPGTFNEHEEQRIAASLVATVPALDPGYRRTDHVVYGHPNLKTGAHDKIFAVQGDLYDPANHRESVFIQTALATSVERSSEVAQSIFQARQLSEQQAPQKAQDQGLTTPSTTGPVMRIGGRTLGSPGADGGGGGGDGSGGE